jgi:hypothetical protein
MTQAAHRAQGRPRWRALAILTGLASLAGCANDHDRPPDFRGEEEFTVPWTWTSDRLAVEDRLTREAEALCVRKFGRPLEDIDFRWRQCNVLSESESSDECVRWRAWCEPAPRLPDPLVP